MAHEYVSTVQWSGEENEHGQLSMDCGYSCGFDKPIEFGGAEGVLNPEDAFVGSLAMCYSITFKSTLEKMRLEIDGFELTTKGILEDVEDGSMITEITVKPRIKLKDEGDREKVERAVKLAKENCLISKSMKSEIKLEPEIGSAD